MGFAWRSSSFTRSTCAARMPPELWREIDEAALLVLGRTGIDAHRPRLEVEVTAFPRPAPRSVFVCPPSVGVGDRDGGLQIYRSSRRRRTASELIFLDETFLRGRLLLNALVPVAGRSATGRALCTHASRGSGRSKFSAA